MGNEDESPIFDGSLFGLLLRNKRQKQYNRAVDFCEVVSNMTGVKINKEALYRIEKGVQLPTIEQLVAFGLVLNHGVKAKNLINSLELDRCLTRYSEYIADSPFPIECLPSFDGLYYDSDGNVTSEVTPDDIAYNCIDERYIKPPAVYDFDVETDEDVEDEEDKDDGLTDDEREAKAEQEANNWKDYLAEEHPNVVEIDGMYIDLS